RHEGCGACCTVCVERYSSSRIRYNTPTILPYRHSHARISSKSKTTRLLLTPTSPPAFHTSSLGQLDFPPLNLIPFPLETNIDTLHHQIPTKNTLPRNNLIK